MTRIAKSLLVAGAAVGSCLSLPAVAADVVISSGARDLISEVAEATRELRLASVPADLRVQSDSMVFDYQSGELAYSGDVRVMQGGVRLLSDDLKIAFEPRRAGDVQSVHATGNVKVIHRDRTASGNLAVYDPGTATITLTGDARLGSGPNVLEGERVVVFLDEGRAVVEGGAAAPEPAAGTAPGQRQEGRVRAIIDPSTLDIEGLTD